jgi:hypothetical protein
MNNQYNNVIVLAIAIIFILAGFFVAVLTLMGTFEEVGFEFLSGFNTYIFGMAIALTLLIIGGLLLFFGLHGN